MRAFAKAPGCLMQTLLHGLDGSKLRPCGRCAACAGPLLPDSVDPQFVDDAVAYIRSRTLPVEPRTRWPSGMWRDATDGAIEARFRNEEGRALCVYNDAGWGRLVAAGKYHTHRFDDALVQAAADLVLQQWRPQPAPSWVTFVPSRRRPELVQDFASRLAAALDLPVRQALVDQKERPEQKQMRNNAKQCENIRNAFQVVPERVRAGPVLLVDDMVDSRWTFTVAGLRLREAGSGPVFPFALAKVRETERWSRTP